MLTWHGLCSNFTWKLRFKSEKDECLLLIPLLLAGAYFAQAARSLALSPALPSNSETLVSEEHELTKDINSERIQRGLNPLAFDPLLVRAARAHSREMCSLNYFSHRSPLKAARMPMDRYLCALRAAGLPVPSSVMVGENLYYSSLFTPGDTVGMAKQALMDSPDHQAILLGRRFAKIGVGVYQDSSGQFWVTEMFLQDSDQ